TRVVQEYVTSLAVTPDGKTIAAGHSNGAVRFWSIENDTLFERNPLRPQPSVGAFVVSPDGRTMAVYPEDQELGLWDLATLMPLRLPVELNFAFGQTIPLAYSPDGRTLVMAHAPAAQLRLLQIEPQGPSRVSPGFGRSPTGASFSPDGRLLLELS